MCLKEASGGGGTDLRSRQVLAIEAARVVEFRHIRRQAASLHGLATCVKPCRRCSSGNNPTFLCPQLTATEGTAVGRSNLDSSIASVRRNKFSDSPARPSCFTHIARSWSVTSTCSCRRGVARPCDVRESAGPCRGRRIFVSSRSDVQGDEVECRRPSRISSSVGLKHRN